VAASNPIDDQRRAGSTVRPEIGRLSAAGRLAAAMSAPEIDPLDFLAIDRLLSDEERDIRDAVRAFVRSEILPGVGEWFERGEFPREVA
jgi:hypothetical protein